MSRHTQQATHSVQLLSEQTRLLYGAVNGALLATTINSSLLVAVMWSVVSHSALLTWFAALMALSFVRFFIARSYRASSGNDNDAGFWYRRFAIGTILAAMCWGGAAVFVYPQQGIGYQVFFTFVLGGMAAGSLTSLSVERKIASAFLVLLMLPLLVRVFLSQTQFNIIMGLMLSYYLVMFIVTAQRNSANIEKNIIYEIDLKQRQLELKQQDQRYQVLLESASDAFFLHDLEGRLIDVNKLACSCLGYSKEELLQLSVSDIEKGADPKLLTALWPTLMSSGKLEVECIHQRKDGSTFPVEVHLGPVEMGDKKYISAFVRDISVHKKALADSNRAKLEAQRLNQAKSEFLSRMSHELRTPLNAIMGFSQVLQMEESQLSKNHQINVNEIYNASEYLLELIEELLDLSKIELDKLDINMAKVDISPILAECIHMIELQARDANVEIETYFCQSNVAVWGDNVRVKQVIVNLLSNAIKFNSKPGLLTVKTKLIDGARLRLSVLDTGKGISEQEMSQLFEPFERLDDFNEIGGSGIGLAIVKHLVKAMGAEIGVNSQKGQGSEFWIDFELYHDGQELHKSDETDVSSL